MVNLSDLNLGTSLASDYEELILSYPVLDIVIEKMDLDMTSDELSQMISLNNPNNTRLLEITVTSTDPLEAMELANEVAEVAIEYLPDTMSTSSPNLAQAAKVATEKSAPSYTRFTLTGAILGLLLSCWIIIDIYLLNDTISSGQELEKYFGIVPLIEIPESEILTEYAALSENKKSRGKSKRGEAKMNKLYVEMKELPYAVEEAMNRLRINIKFCGKNTKKILHTSSFMSEGKSTVSTYLWKMLAEAEISPVSEVSSRVFPLLMIERLMDDSSVSLPRIRDQSAEMADTP